MPSKSVEYLTLGEVNGLAPITIPADIARLWDLVKADLYPVYVVVTDSNNRVLNAGYISDRISAWLATKADEYATKMDASGGLSRNELLKPVMMRGKTGHSDMPITTSFNDIASVDGSKPDVLSDVTQTETTNEMATPVMRLAEIGERLPNFAREFVSEFYDHFALYGGWVYEI